MPDLAKELVAVRGENEALRRAIASYVQAGGQRSQVVFSMWAEALAQIAEAANAGDPKAKQVCRQVSDVFGLVKSAAGGIVVPK